MELAFGEDDMVEVEMENTLREIQTLRSELGMPTLDSAGLSGVLSGSGLSGALPSATMSGGFAPMPSSAEMAARPQAIQVTEMQTIVGNYIVEDQRSGEGLLGEGGQAK